MKKLFLSVIILTLTHTHLVFGGNEPGENTDRLVVKFTDPAKPGFIETSLINGGITVVGYQGKEVIIEAIPRSKKISRNEKSWNNPEKVKGMIKLPVTATGLTVEEEHNKMEISVESWKRTIDLNLRVQVNTSLKLSCFNAGDIKVENINGELEVSNINGKVTLSNISGSIVAHALNNDLLVTMNKVDPKKSMSFSTMNGNIDVTFPANLRANVKLKSDNGDIYSDFEIRMEENPRKVIEENTREKDGKYRVQIEHAIWGSINGGGPEFQFTSFQGDIFIRKEK